MPRLPLHPELPASTRARWIFDVETCISLIALGPPPPADRAGSIVLGRFDAQSFWSRRATARNLSLASCGTAVAELEVEPVAGRDQHCRRDQAAQHVNGVVVAAVNSGEAEQDGDREMDVA